MPARGWTSPRRTAKLRDHDVARCSRGPRLQPRRHGGDRVQRLEHARSLLPDRGRPPDGPRVGGLEWLVRLEWQLGLERHLGLVGLERHVRLVGDPGRCRNGLAEPRHLLRCGDRGRRRLLLDRHDVLLSPTRRYEQQLHVLWQCGRAMRRRHADPLRRPHGLPDGPALLRAVRSAHRLSCGAVPVDVRHDHDEPSRRHDGPLLRCEGARRRVHGDRQGMRAEREPRRLPPLQVGLLGTRVR